MNSWLNMLLASNLTDEVFVFSSHFLGSKKVSYQDIMAFKRRVEAADPGDDFWNHAT